MLVEAWLPRAAAAQPDRPAVGALTYAELLDAALAGMRALRSRGVRAGDRVALTLPAGEAFATALHATLLAGAVAVPVDPRLPAGELARQTAGAAVVIDEPLGAASGSGELTPQLTHDLDAPAIVVHTSGTSAAARAVPLTYGNWLWSALGSAAALGRAADERWLCCLPLWHVGGLSIVLRSAIGATTALVHERFEADRVLDALNDPGGPTLVSLVPTTLTRLLDSGLERPPALRWVLLGGASISTGLLDRAAAAGVPVAATYGMTEACSQIATLGRPLFCTSVELSADGEILVSGPTISPSAAPILRTGDLGSISPAGELVITGRKDDTIITGGENVAPDAVEAVLLEHPSVAESAVHGRADPAWGQIVVATVVLHAEAPTTEHALRAWCAGRLAPHQVPKRIELRAGPLPRTASGKLLRRELR